MRAKCNRIQAIPNELTLLTANLPSGYHRDLQLTKEILFPAIEDMKACIEIAALMLRNIVVNDNLLENEQYKYLFTVEKINAHVNTGISFRDAYQQIGNEIAQGSFNYSSALHHTHEGSIGNLCNEEIKNMMNHTIKGFGPV